MSNSENKRSEILKDTAVYEYVAGNQSDAARRRFEKLLKDDEQLQKAVIVERALREALSRSANIDSIPMSNFDELLSRIDELEASDIVEQASINAVTQGTPSNNVIAMPNRRIRQFSIAACIAIMGVVAVNFFGQLTEPKYTVLGNEQASKEVNIMELANQNKLAKMVLSEELDTTEIGNILARYELETFESGATIHNIYVIAEQSIDDELLSLWRDDPRIKQADMVSFSEKK